jgi:hypothetical protein
MAVIDSYSESNADISQALNSGGTTGMGQAFTGTGAKIGSAKWYLKKTGSPTGNATASIYASTGTFGTSAKPTGAALATSDNFDVSTLTTSSVLTTFSFTGANRISPTNGTKYIVTIEYSGGDSSNHVDAGYDQTSPTHGGNWSSLSGGSWSALSFLDGVFYLNSYEAPEPSVPLSFGGVYFGQPLRGAGVLNSQSTSVTQVAASVTATGGTQSVVATIIQSVSITQIAASVTATGGTQVVQTNSSNAQVAANVTAAGGTQTVASVQNASITQVAGTVTAAGGTQVIATVNNVSISQVAATVTASGGTQVIATVNNVAISQLAANVTATGGTQTIATVNNSAITQVAGVVTATGGTQVVASVQNVAITQVAGVVTASGGAQTITANGSGSNASVAQVAATVTATGGDQQVSALTNAVIAQLAANVTATGGTQIISTSTGPLPTHRSPSIILLTDGRVAAKAGGNIYIPL